MKNDPEKIINSYSCSDKLLAQTDEPHMLLGILPGFPCSLRDDPEILFNPFQEFWEAVGAKDEGTDLTGDPYAPEKYYYKNSKREAQGLWADMEAHLSKAWSLRPGCTELAFVLVQAWPVMSCLFDVVQHTKMHKVCSTSAGCSTPIFLLYFPCFSSISSALLKFVKDFFACTLSLRQH